MIFVTVGVQLPFDRLVRTVDEWAVSRNKSEVFAQVGVSNYVPRRLTAYSFLSDQDFHKYMENAEIIVSHAGMGTIITALELGKRIIVMPRQAALGEHRNDHQSATAKHMLSNHIVSVAADEAELLKQLNDPGPFATGTAIAESANESLLKFLSKEIEETPARRRWSIWPNPARLG